MVIHGKSVIAGECQGEVVWTDTPLSFWGGVDPQSGTVVDQHHPLCGTCMTNRVLIIPSTRGSSTSSGILLEMIRSRTAPQAIVTRQLDPVLALGAIIGEKVYGRTVVMITVDANAFATLKNCATIAIKGDAIRASDPVENPIRPDGF
jgi:predicted aconitase with swiveling domain